MVLEYVEESRCELPELELARQGLFGERSAARAPCRGREAGVWGRRDVVFLNGWPG